MSSEESDDDSGTSGDPSFSSDTSGKSKKKRFLVSHVSSYGYTSGETFNQK